jgi:glucose-6-phosphate isomerase
MSAASLGESRVSANIVQNVAGCLTLGAGSRGLTASQLQAWLNKLQPALSDLKQRHAAGSLPLLNISSETADIAAAEAALTKLCQGARTLIFFGTGGSGLGGQTLAQLGGWNLPGVTQGAPHSRPRTRFYDNLDATTLAGALEGVDLPTTRFVFTSKSGGTSETLAQAITTLTAIKSAGLGDKIPSMFLGLTEPAIPGRANGLRALFSSLNIPMLDHHTGIGGRFSALTNVGLLPAMARGLNARTIRAGAQGVIDAMLASETPQDLAPAIGAATMVGLSKDAGIRTLVMMPYSDRLGKFSEWYVQLWAESLGKGGEGTSPIPALGPVDQHSQLQLFMDGPPEIAVTLVRVASRGAGQAIDKEMAATAGIGFMGGKTIGDVVDAQSHAVAEALVKAGRPVRMFDIAKLDEHAIGALLMHFMLETIFAGALLNLDPFDQPAVELAKILTKERLSQS